MTDFGNPFAWAYPGILPAADEWRVQIHAWGDTPQRSVTVLRGNRAVSPPLRAEYLARQEEDLATQAELFVAWLQRAVPGDDIHYDGPWYTWLTEYAAHRGLEPKSWI